MVKLNQKRQMLEPEILSDRALHLREKNDLMFLRQKKNQIPSLTKAPDDFFFPPILRNQLATFFLRLFDPNTASVRNAPIDLH